MEWAIEKDKPFFIGKRSLSILQKKPIKRKLVGFMLPENPADRCRKNAISSSKTERITGRVTSVVLSRRSSAIGTADVATEQSEIGTPFTIRLDGERGGAPSRAPTVTATVVKIPFYDPDGLCDSEGVKKKVKATAEVASV